MTDTKDESKKRILARRAKFMMAALAVSGVACAKVDDDPKPTTTDSGADTRPNVCLSADAEPCLGVSADAEPCLEPPLEDTGPMPCLDPVPDSGTDTGPEPCLSPPPPDSGA